MKFGRKPRGYDSRIPKLSQIKRKTAAATPASVNYSAGMPASLGAMLNDSLGDCTCAAVGHAIQTFSFNADAGNMITPSDAQIEALYELAGGYVPGNPSTDNGAVIQTVLQDWFTNPVDGNELAGYVEIDQMTAENMQTSIYEAGVVDVGFNVPSYLPMGAGSVWDVEPSADNTIIGGHSVALVGYETDGTYVLISWGSIYYMTPAFCDQFVDEAYALANPLWMESTGLSPAGLSLAELQALMQTIGFIPPGDGARRRHRRIKRRRAVAG